MKTLIYILVFFLSLSADGQEVVDFISIDNHPMMSRWDGDGNIYLTYEFKDSLQNTDGSVIYSGTRTTSVLWLKLNRNQNIEWYKVFTNNTDVRLNNMGTSQWKKAYISLIFIDSIVVDSNTIYSNGGRDFLLLQYDSESSELDNSLVVGTDLDDGEIVVDELIFSHRPNSLYYSCSFVNASTNQKDTIYVGS